MPVTTKDITAPSGRVSSLATVPVEGSVLSTAAVIDMSNAQQPNDAWIEIGLMSGGKTPQHKVATLASDYTGRASPVSWTGKIITESSMYLYADIYSSSGGSFRLVGLVNPYKVGADGGLILDP